MLVGAQHAGQTFWFEEDGLHNWAAAAVKVISSRFIASCLWSGVHVRFEGCYHEARAPGFRYESRRGVWIMWTAAGDHGLRTLTHAAMTWECSKLVQHWQGGWPTHLDAGHPRRGRGTWHVMHVWTCRVDDNIAGVGEPGGGEVSVPIHRFRYFLRCSDFLYPFTLISGGWYLSDSLILYFALHHATWHIPRTLKRIMFNYYIPFTYWFIKVI